MKSRQVVVRFPPDLYDAIRENSAESGMTVTQWIRSAVRSKAIIRAGGVPMQGQFAETVNYDKNTA